MYSSIVAPVDTMLNLSGANHSPSSRLAWSDNCHPLLRCFVLKYLFMKRTAPTLVVNTAGWLSSPV